MAVPLAIYKTLCDSCPSVFNTTTALLRHREAKHEIYIETQSAALLKIETARRTLPLHFRLLAVCFSLEISAGIMWKDYLPKGEWDETWARPTRPYCHTALLRSR